MSEPTIKQAFQSAFQHHQAGQLQQAENLYRQILAQEPNHAESLHFLGVIAHQAGRNDIAVELIRKALMLKPNYPEAQNNLGNVLKAAGQPGDAIAAFRRAINLKPDHPNIYNSLGEVLMANRQLDEAINAFRQALALKPDYPQAHNNLGVALFGLGRLDEALAAFRQAITFNPNFSEAHGNLGIALKDKGQLDQALTATRQAIALQPNSHQAHNNLGNILKEKGQLDEAIIAYRQAITCKPDFLDAHCNLGVALADNGQLGKAIAAYRQAILLRPDLPELHYNLGNAQKDKYQPAEAIIAYRQAIALKPNYAQAHNNLGHVLKEQGQLDEAIAACRQTLALNPNAIEAHSNLLFNLHYHPGYDAQTIAAEHHRWNLQHAEPLTKYLQPHTNDRNPDRRLRIGYVSPDFNEHPVGRFLLPLLAQHDKSRFEIFTYAQVSVPDSMTERLRSHTDGWRSTIGLTDTQVVDLIRRDRIDILVDLSGHTAGNRLLVFARKPAPVQVTWLGYPNTTGLETMDYRLTDAHADPPGQTEQLHSEQLTRLSPCCWCYSPLQSPPVIARREGPITFGCFNNFAKVTEPMLRLWGRILQAMPESRLLLKGLALGSDSACQRVRRIFSDEGIDPERLELRGYELNHNGHMEFYSRLDIALDTFPYHGTTTTCEALWMGVPVVTLAGQTHVSRVGMSLLSNAGLPELVGRDPDDYLQIALSLAFDKSRLAELRLNLRQRMERSPLMDAPAFARNVEAAYLVMWQKWCAFR